MLCGVSGLAFAIGVYLPLASMLTIYVGGCVRALVDRRRALASGEVKNDPAILAASGLVAGEGLAGVLVAFLAFENWIPKERPPIVGGAMGDMLVLAVTLALCLLLYAAGRRDQQSAVEVA
jgi:OPT oligopeptide transporter protein